MSHDTTNRPRMAATYAPGTVRARRWRRARLPSASRLDSPRRPDRPTSHHGPRLAACRAVDHRNQRIGSSHAPKPLRLGRGECQKSGRGGGRARFQGSKPKRPFAAFGQAAKGRRTSSLARGKPSKPIKAHISATAHSADDMPNAPRRNGRGLWAYAPACCGRLHESVPCSTLAVRCLYATKDGSPTHHLASMRSFHATHQACGRKLWQERSYLVAGALTWPRQGTSR